jgi:hypothetical protein
MIQPLHETTILSPYKVIRDQIHFLVQSVHKLVKTLDLQKTCSLELATVPGITDEPLVNQWLAGQLSLKGGRWVGLAVGF